MYAWYIYIHYVCTIIDSSQSDLINLVTRELSQGGPCDRDPPTLIYFYNIYNYISFSRILSSL